MEIEHISCIRKYEAIINVNISDLDKHYDGHDQLNYKNDGNICTEDENCYPLTITVEDDVSGDFYPSDGVDNDSYITKYFGIQVDGVSEMKCEANLVVEFSSTDLDPIIFESNGGFKKVHVENICQNISSIKYRLLRKFDLQQDENYQYCKINAIKGQLTLTLMPEIGAILKERLVKNFSKLLDPMLSKEKSDEFQLHCQNEVIIFHKPLLKAISEPFGNLLDNPNFKETQNGIMKIKETLPETIKAFKRIFYEKIIEKKDLNLDLMLFANQYDIKPLVDLCRDHLGKSFTKENIIQIVDAAFKIEDGELLKKAINFIRLNVEDFQEDVAWKDYMKSNPDCTAKIMFMLMKS